jgi:hypothetical protein
VDNFAVFANGFDETIRRKDETFALVNSLGLNIHPTKGYHTATQVGEHLGMEMDFEQGDGRLSGFRQETQGHLRVRQDLIHLLYKAAANKRWVHVKALASLARKAQFLYLAILVARFYLRELYAVVSSAESWSGTV